MITRALLAVCGALAVFASLQTLRLSWARAELSEASEAALDAALESARLSAALDLARKSAENERNNLARDIVRQIETGNFANADAPLDPALTNQLERLRFGNPLSKP